MKKPDPSPENLPLLYTTLSEWWPLLSAPEDYRGEAEFFTHTLIEFSKRPPKTVLELGSGGGNNAFFMKEHFQLTLVDRSAGMLAVSKKLNPACEHLQADMRTLDLNRTFDAVFIHDAIMYCTNLRDLYQALRTAYVHCIEEGVVLVVPDFVRETFQPDARLGGHDGPDRAMRYLEWIHDPDQTDTVYITDFAYMLRDESGEVETIYDRHEMGLFSQVEWLTALSDNGFDPKVIQDPYERMVFVGVRCPDS